MGKVLLIIDPQNDFVDPKGSLYIPGAEKGIDAICEFIEKENPLHIIITQDTHQVYHIGHPEFWEGDPEPFTKITIEDLKSGKYRPKEPGSLDYFYEYIDLLPDKVHMIWPKHCINGSWGHSFPKKLTDALISWSKKDILATYRVIQKGEYALSEMYSAISHVNSIERDIKESQLLKDLAVFDKVCIAGFAKDVCVAWTVKDLLASGKFNNKLIFLDKCMVGLDPNAKTLEVFTEGVNECNAVWE